MRIASAFAVKIAGLRAAARGRGVDEPDAGIVSTHWLPDFCSLPVLFAVMIVAEFLVLAILLAPGDESRPLLPRLATTSVFVQWLALLCAVCLCKLRQRLERLSPMIGVMVAYLLMLTVTALGSAIVFMLDQQLSLELTLPAQFEARFILRNAALCALLGAALLRYFYVLEQWRARVRTEAKMRFEALQARIRPHFLFNSMNTIASLIRTRPADAERAIEDLSDLFRAALGRANAHDTLGNEIELVRRYLAIEQLRLGERLRIQLDVDDLPADLPLPALLLQPLVENAVYHGIEPLPQGGIVSIHGRRKSGTIQITIRNPRPSAGVRASSRHGIALSNIRSRIEYHFGRRGTLDIEDAADYFQICIELPCSATTSVDKINESPDR